MYSHCQGLAALAEAIEMLQGELVMVAGSEYKLVADLTSCMKKGGVGFYARQGWTGGDVVWEMELKGSTHYNSKARKTG